jgi:hypothetical protein
MKIYKNFFLLENRLPFLMEFQKKKLGFIGSLMFKKRKIRIRDLDEQKSKLIIEVFEKFSINGRRRLNSTEKYDELIEFIQR